MLKKELRQLYKAKRIALEDTIIESLNNQLLDQFKTILPKQPIHLLTFAPITKWKEPDVNLVTAFLQQEHLVAFIAFPKIDDNQQTFKAIAVNENTNFSIHHFDINEPQNGAIVDPQTIDVVFIPLLTFDKKGYRVGYGKGMYDKYLQQCKPEVVKIGFSFFPPVDCISDVNEYDVPMDYCITPQQCYSFHTAH